MNKYTKEDLKELKDNPLLNKHEAHVLNSMYITNNINESVLYAVEQLITARSQECHTQKMV